MRHAVVAGIIALALLTAPAVWGSGFQDPPGDGTAPSGITQGDAAQGYVGPLLLEFRDIPNGRFQLQLAASRTLRIATRLRGDNAFPDGPELQVFAADFVCGDPLPPGAADVCVAKDVCTIGKNGKETCASEMLIDFQAPASSYQTLVAFLLGPRIVAAYGLDASTVVLIEKVDEFALGPVTVGADGVRSAYVAQDIAISAE
jgi:hypothetical protein